MVDGGGGGAGDGSYPAGMHYLATRALARIGRKESNPHLEADLHGDILYLKALCREELEDRPRYAEAWNRLVESGDGPVSKQERYQQLEILIGVLKSSGILKNQSISAWDLEAFEGKQVWDIEGDLEPPAEAVD